MKNEIKIFQKKLKHERGITLIALVTTIVIIVMLVSVTIVGVFMQNGIINKSEYSNKIEESSIELYDGPREVDGVKIPDGFYYVGGTKDEGIIISDKKDDLKKGTNHDVATKLIGNQFVWIPVKDDNKFKRYEGYYNGKLDSELSSCNEPYSSGYATEQDEFDEMKASVLEHNGFFVGRYETGTNSKRTRDTGITDEALIKQGKNVYNYISLSNSDDMENEKGGAVEKAKKFSEEHGYSSVKSTLIYGVQWDAIMNFIDPKYSEEKCDTSSSFVANSTGKGWYNRSEPTTTGLNASYAVKNIYDLGGNVYEWTMESSNDCSRVNRGRQLP